MSKTTNRLRRAVSGTAGARKLLTWPLPVFLLAVVMTTTADAQEPSPSPQCTTISMNVRFGPGSSSYSAIYPVSIPAGTATIPAAASGDMYLGRSNHVQLSERWEVQFLAADGTVLAISNPTEDVPDGGSDEQMWMGSLGEVSLSAPATGLQIMHRPDLPDDGTANSVQAAGVTVCWSTGESATSPTTTNSEDSETTSPTTDTTSPTTTNNNTTSPTTDTTSPTTTNSDTTSPTTDTTSPTTTNSEDSDATSPTTDTSSPTTTNNNTTSPTTDTTSPTTDTTSPTTTNSEDSDASSPTTSSPVADDNSLTNEAPTVPNPSTQDESTADDSTTDDDDADITTASDDTSCPCVCAAFTPELGAPFSHLSPLQLDRAKVTTETAAAQLPLVAGVTQESRAATDAGSSGWAAAAGLLLGLGGLLMTAARRSGIGG